MQVVRLGLDVAKNVFQVHGVDAEGSAVLKRKIRRNDLLRFFGDLPPCLVELLPNLGDDGLREAAYRGG